MMSISDEAIAQAAVELDRALLDGRPIAPLSARHPGLSVDDAYRISRTFLERRLARGARVVGKKIGATSKAVQDMLGVSQPDFGVLLADMQLEDGGEVRIAGRLIQPRAEAEIAFLLRDDLPTEGVDEAMVLAAAAAVAPCFEIVDSRIEDWRIGIADTVADNASCGAFVLGARRVDPTWVDLPGIEARVFKNGALVSRGFGSAVQGSPLTAVAWLANALGRYGEQLRAGDWILSGSLVPLEPAAPGDAFRVEIDVLGEASVRFV